MVINIGVCSLLMIQYNIDAEDQVTETGKVASSMGHIGARNSRFLKILFICERFLLKIYMFIVT